MTTGIPPIRMRTLALLTSMALAQAAAVTAVRADSFVGVDKSQGNTLNPAPINPSTAGRWMDEEGLGTRVPAARTPTGKLYDIPLDPGEEPEAKKDEWRTSGYIELGGIRTHGDPNPIVRNYQDLRSGLYVNNFGISTEKRADACFAELVGGGVGRNDQFYTLQFGRYNDWKVTSFYNETPHAFTTTYRSLWNGVGGDSLTLVNLAPGGTANANTTQANIQNALAATGDSTLEIVRKKAGVRLDMNVAESWKVYASFTDEKRTGARPFGAVFGGGGGGGDIEVAESIDYHSIDFLAGLQFSDPTSSFNLRASASFFRNDIDTMSFQNPLYISLNGISGLSPTVFRQGLFDQPPNNEQYNVKAEYARALADFYRANLTATVALGSMRQNDNLIPPSEYALTGGTVTAGGASLANAWNTTAALSQLSAAARIDTVLADLTLALKPASALDVRGKVRYYETRNAMQYQACNPLTGQWGRLLNNGSGLSLVTAMTAAGVNPAATSANAFNTTNCNLAAAQGLDLVPSAGNIPIRSVPYDYQQLNANLSADYRFGRASSVNASIERENFRREFRERDQTWEDKIKLGYVDRGMIDGMIRLSYEYARRGGGDYNQNPYQPFLSASLGPTPSTYGVAMSSWFHSIEQFRSYDLSDRNQNLLNGRVNYIFLPTLDGALTLQLKDATFPDQYGRTGRQKSDSVTLDLNYQAGSMGVVYGFYSYQTGAMEQKGVQPNSCILGNTYYFYSNGQVLNAVTGARAPAAPAGSTLVATQDVAAGNWYGVCGTASEASPLFPDSRGWQVASKDRNHVIGAGIKYDFSGKAMLDASFTRSLGRTEISYSYNPVALGMTAVQAALAGDGFTDLVFAQNIFNANLMVPLTKDVTMRFLVRHEAGKIRDWHYDGVAANPVPANNAVYLDAGPRDYRATTVGIMFLLRL